MPTRPRIRRLEQPTGGITEAPEPLPVIVTLRWVDGRSQDLPAIARAWTAAAVLVEWRWSDRPHDRQLDWVPALDVRRDLVPKQDRQAAR